MLKGFIYLLLSEKDKKTYLGSTNDWERRLREHNKGACGATKWRRPFRLIYKEELNSLSEARFRERFLKTKQGRKELKKIFENIGM